MVCFNMGHDWQDYDYSEDDPEVIEVTSSTFGTEDQNQFFMDALTGAAERSVAERR